MTTATETKTCDYNHLLLYAKDHYEKGDVIEDVKTILAERCGLQSAKHVSDENMWHMVNHAFLKYCFTDVERFMRELFKPMPDEDGYNVFQFFTDNCPLRRAVRLALLYLARVKVLNEDGARILELGRPDPNVLPLRNKEKSQ